MKDRLGATEQGRIPVHYICYISITHSVFICQVSHQYYNPNALIDWYYLEGF